MATLITFPATVKAEYHPNYEDMVAGFKDSSARMFRALMDSAQEPADKDFFKRRLEESERRGLPAFE